MKIVNFFIEFIQNKRIRTQLILMYLPIAIAAILLLSIISINITTNAFTAKTETYIYDTIELINEGIANKLKEYEAVSSEIISDYSLYRLLTEEESSMGYYEMYETVKQKLNDVTQSAKNISSIYVYPQGGGRVINTDGTAIKASGDYQQSEQYYNILTNNKQKFWTNVGLTNPEDTQHYIYLQRAVPGTENTLGVVQIQFPEETVYELYSRVALFKNANIYIVDENGKIISDAIKDRINTGIDMNHMDIIRKGNGSFRTKINGKDTLVVFSGISPSNWKLIVELPMNFIYGDNIKLVINTVFIALMVTVFIILVTLFISSAYVKPLKKIGHAMKHVETHNFENKIDYPYSNEIGDISRRFNAMIDRIKNLMIIIEEKEKQKSELDMQFLQAQIRPHFIYNTLFTIKCLAMMNDQKEIETLLTSFINLLMASISKEGTYVEIQKEIDYIKDYVYIMNYKHDDKIMVDYQIDEETKQCLILSLLLQPIVENAILHGMVQGEEKLLITVKCHIVDDDITIRIRDNGIGVNSREMNEKLKSTKRSSSEGFSGIGVENVNERLKLYFGDRYGLSYSEIESGTEAVLAFPKMSKGGIRCD